MNVMTQKGTILGRMERYFIGCEYATVDLHSEKMSLFYTVRDNCAYLVWMIENTAIVDMDRTRYMSYYQTILNRFQSQGFQTVQMLTLFATSNSAKVKELADGTAFWIADEVYGRLIVYENQMEDYLGLRSMIEQNLHFGADIRNADGIQQKGIVESTHSSNQKNDKAEAGLKGQRLKFGVFVLQQCRYLITFVLIISNAVIFFLENDDLLNRFGNYWRDVLDGGEYYRLITSCFLHQDTEHIISNMLILLLIGMELEKRMGHIWFGVTYLLSGVLASVASCWYHWYMKEEALCIGASGAIYGIMGAVILMIFLEERNENMTSIRVRLCFFVAYMFYGIYSSEGNIDNAAHVGGFVAGTIIVLLYQLVFLRLKKRKRNLR